MFKTKRITVKINLLYGYSFEDLSNILLNIDNFDKLVPYCNKIELIESLSETEKNIKFWFEIFYLKKYVDFLIKYDDNIMEIISNEKEYFKHFFCSFKLVLIDKNITQVEIFLDFHSTGYIINQLLTSVLM